MYNQPFKDMLVLSSDLLQPAAKIKERSSTISKALLVFFFTALESIKLSSIQNMDLHYVMY